MSYGVNAPQGFQPLKSGSAAVWNEQTTAYRIADAYATSLFKGDPVVTASGYVVIGTAGSAVLGVFWGCKYINSIGTYIFSPYWPASTATFATAGAECYVIDDPKTLFNIQLSLAGLTQAQIGNNANFVAGSGSTITGQSAYALDSSTVSTGNATYNCKIRELTPSVNNAFGVNYNNAVVSFNNDVYNSGTGTVGR